MPIFARLLTSLLQVVQSPNFLDYRFLVACCDRNPNPLAFDASHFDLLFFYFFCVDCCTGSKTRIMPPKCRMKRVS